MKTFFTVIVIAIMALVISLGLRMCTRATDSAGHVMDRTLDGDNIIYTYEWFHDVNAKVVSRAGQIHEYQIAYDAEPVGDEKARLRVDLSAARQSCRDLVTEYNANSAKVNRNIFKGNSLPATLDIAQCEAK